MTLPRIFITRREIPEFRFSLPEFWEVVFNVKMAEIEHSEIEISHGNVLKQLSLFNGNIKDLLWLLWLPLAKSGKKPPRLMLELLSWADFSLIWLWNRCLLRETCLTVWQMCSELIMCHKSQLPFLHAVWLIPYVQVVVVWLAFISIISGQINWCKSCHVINVNIREIYL